MQYLFANARTCLVTLGCLCFCTGFASDKRLLQLTSKDGLNTIAVFLSENGTLSYQVSRKGVIILQPSPLGLLCNDQDFTRGLSLVEVSPVRERREQYKLKISNSKLTDQLFTTRDVTLKNKAGARIIVELVSGKEGVAFRYRFPEEQQRVRVIRQETTAFSIHPDGKGWLQPYNKASPYTPAYEDFYFEVDAGDTVSHPRNPSDGWCMPALFRVNGKKTWMLLAETGTDGSYAGCHLENNAGDALYRIAFPKEAEKFQVPVEAGRSPEPRSTLPWTMPRRLIIISDNAAGILLSTMVTDLAPASKIKNPSWVEPGRASWSWWSHPEDKSAEVYNQFTELAQGFGWEYTLFDAGWEKANQASHIIDTALARGVKPLVWGFSGDYYEPEKRKQRLNQFARMGISGVKIDFWCSDRQEVMDALYGVFEDAANEKLLVNLHGVTVPRGWHRTWPNFLTAEAILGSESYFYEKRFPDRAAEQNTVLPFTRNVAGPADYTPVALSKREFPRLNTGVHELALTLIYTSGIIHFADSGEVFKSLPDDVRKLLMEMPVTWDKTEGIVCEPGEAIVLSRRKDSLSYIVGINGTSNETTVKLDLKKYAGGFSHFRIFREGKDPLMDFDVKTYPVDTTERTFSMAPKGGFIIRFLDDVN